MKITEACLAVEAFMRELLEKRESFYPEAYCDLDYDWEDDAPPLELAMVTYHEEFNTVLALVSCAAPLEVDRMPAIVWIDECGVLLREGLLDVGAHYTLKVGGTHRLGPWASYRRSWPGA